MMASNFVSFFSRDKTFRPNKKSFPEGTLRYHLHRQANASLNSGLDLKLVVKLPRGEDLNEWIAVHVVDFFNRVNVIFGVLCDFCNAETCPVMSGGPKYEYYWCDGVNYKKPTKLPATKYIELLMDWVELQVNNEELFPQTAGVPFPRNYMATVKKIMTRLFRVFVHVYLHHFDKMVVLGAEAHVNACYKHFYYFACEFNLVGKRELEPLKQLSERLCH